MNTAGPNREPSSVALNLDEPEREVHERLERASMYRLLGWAFAYPVPEELQALAWMARGVAVGAPPEIAGPIERLAEAAEEADPADVAGEYVFLFDRGAKCPPYEGAWGDGPQLAGKSALLADIAGFYTAFGLAPALIRPDMEDHIAAECEFMSALILKEAWALADGHKEGLDVTAQAQRSFLADHLGRWAETFCDALRDATPLPYYLALADLLAAWTRIEADRVGISPAAVGGPSGYDPIRDEEAFTCPMAPEPAAE